MTRAELIDLARNVEALSRAHNTLATDPFEALTVDEYVAVRAAIEALGKAIAPVRKRLNDEAAL